jgi:hypothetical protein
MDKKLIKDIIDKYELVNYENNYIFIIYNSKLKETCDYIKNENKNNIEINNNLYCEMNRMTIYLEKYYRPNEMINAIFIMTNDKIIEEQLDVMYLTRLIDIKYKKISYIYI